MHHFYKVSEVARNLGIHHGSPRRWKKQFETNGNQVFPGKGAEAVHGTQGCEGHLCRRRLQLFGWIAMLDFL